MCNCQVIYYKRLKRQWIIPTPQNKSKPTTPRTNSKSGLLWIWLAAVIQLNLSTTATLGTEKSNHCREVYTRVNVWTVRQESDSCSRGGSRGRVQGVRTPPGMTCGRFLINTVQSLDRHTKSALSFDMYSQQFTLCYFLVKSPLLRIRF